MLRKASITQKLNNKTKIKHLLLRHYYYQSNIKGETFGKTVACLSDLLVNNKIETAEIRTSANHDCARRQANRLTVWSD